MKKEQLISEMLLLPGTALDYHIGQNLAKLFPDRALIEGDAFNFNVEGYAAFGHCTLTRQPFTYNQVATLWRGPEPEMMGGMMIEGMDQAAVEPQSADTETGERIKKAWLEVQWQGHSLDVILLHIEGNSYRYLYWLLAKSEEVAHDFFAAVCKWNNEIRSEVLVFDMGRWQKDAHLFQDIKNATFDNLILRGSLKQEIRDDLAQFFGARALYEEHDIPWKRGILFVGPAGNGKTHTIKALLNSQKHPCLYVKSFRAPHGADEVNIRQVFERARRTVPCILVLEDLDSLVTPQNRSFFLNELDGFAANIGIVTLATTNHPERLDPAILDRPSRFDRKYPFDLPELAERKAYITLWNGSLKPMLRLSEEEVDKISEVTEGFSFAYLKELFLSSKMRWIANPQQHTMVQVMTEQVNKLREQMASASAYAEPEASEGQAEMQPGSSFMRGRAFYRSRRLPG